MPNDSQREYYIASIVGFIFSLVFFVSIFISNSLRLIITGIIMFIMLAIVSYLTFRVAQKMKAFEIKTDGITCTFVKNKAETIIRKEDISHLTFFHVQVKIDEEKINDKYYVLSIDTKKKNYRYMPLDFFDNKKKKINITPIIKALSKMGHDVETKGVLIDKMPEERHLFKPEYPEKFGRLNANHSQT